MRLIIWSVVVATFSQSTTAISLPYPKAQEGQQLIANNNEDALRDGIFTAKITVRSCFPLLQRILRLA